MTSVVDPAGWMAAQVRRAARNSVIGNGLVLFVVALLAWLSSHYYDNFFRGPFPFDDARLLAAAEEPGSGGLVAYIELRNRNLVETGWREISTADGKPYSDFPFFMTAVGDKQLIVLARSAADGKHLVGPLNRLGPREQKVVDWMEEHHPELRGKFLPLQLNQVAAFRVFGILGLAVALPAALLCGWNVARAIWALRSPAAHRIIRQLVRYGDPVETANRIDMEVADGPVAKYGKSLLTSLWLLRPTTFGMVVVQLGDVVWMYHLQQTESFAVLCLRNRKSMAVPLRGQQVEKLLAEISTRIPWALYGYDAERVKLWRCRPEGVITQSDRLRAESLKKGDRPAGH